MTTHATSPRPRTWCIPRFWIPSTSTRSRLVKSGHADVRFFILKASGSTSYICWACVFSVTVKLALSVYAMPRFGEEGVLLLSVGSSAAPSYCCCYCQLGLGDASLWTSLESCRLVKAHCSVKGFDSAAKNGLHPNHMRRLSKPGPQQCRVPR